MLYWGDRSLAGGRTLQVQDLSAELARNGYQVSEVDTRRWLQLLRALRTDVDVVHSHGGLSTAFALLLRGRRGNGRPRRVVTLHGWHPSLRSRVENLAERFGLLYSDAITVPNPSMVSRLPARVTARATVVPNGVQAPRPSVSGLGNTGFVVLWLGRVCRAKGIATAVQVMAEARRVCPDLRLEVAGPLEDAQARRLADDPADGLRFHGHVSDPWHVFQPKVLLHTPHYDAGPRAIIEAFGVGVPVVATRVGGIPSMVRDGIDGLLAADDDVPGLASHLVTLASDPERLAAMSRAARSAFESGYSLTAMGQRIAEIYEQVCE